MNSLLEQFLSESRELLENCCSTFLKLEACPTDTTHLNNLFRYVHTIKGGSGLFDIEPYTRLLHITEDSLSKARDGKLIISSSGVDVYLKVVDQLDAWLNQLEADGALAKNADEESDVLIEKIRDVILSHSADEGKKSSITDTESHETPLTMNRVLTHFDLQKLPERLQSELMNELKSYECPVTLFVYRPEANAFFSGDDPISYWSQIPELLWQGIDGDFSNQSLDDFDPYDCRLVLVGISSAKSEAIEQHLGYVRSNVQLGTVEPTIVPQRAVNDYKQICSILTSQLNILQELENNANPKATLSSVKRVFSGLAPTVQGLPQIDSVVCADNKVDPDLLASLQKIIDSFEQENSAVHDTSADFRENEPVVSPQSEEKSNERPAAQKQDTIRTVKVDQDKLEQLVDLTGELIVAKNSLQHLSRRVEKEYGIKALTRDLKSEHAVMNRITESLQDVVMQIRMIPVSTIFQRFPRLIRDLSRRLGKSIELQVEGEDTEADKSIVEQLSDPLIHLVRNSIDHGIEMPNARQAGGKNETGIIRLVAKNIQDSVLIEIHDDGAGIDPLVIKSKAVAKGLITEENASSLSDEEILQLIFEPGFSTCEEVSDLSGRGVGMDVVKTTVSRIGGDIQLQSEVGKGSVIKITLPASITVSRVMMFEINKQVYGIPVEGLTETIKLKPNQIQKIKHREAYVLRDQLVPLYRMHQLLGIRKHLEPDELPILNLNINGTKAGFAVDKLLEGVDVIIKPLEGIMARFPLYSGAAVLGDGRVLLVINPREMTLCH